MTSQPPPAWYALRRTLPTWSFQENLDELIQRLPQYQVDEVIIKVDTEEFTHGQPPLEWVRAYQHNLFRVREAMQELGIRYSLNPWITIGHNDRGRDARVQLPGLRTLVDPQGRACTACACPLDPVWRDHVSAVWTLYAETKPHVLWIEDDIRTFNHNPIEYSCYCEEHLRRFGEVIGRSVSRQELVAAVLAPGEPHPWREPWLRLQASGIEDTAAFLAATVHAASPRTCLGLMSSGPRAHTMENRQWDALATALADGQPLYSRPPMGNYSEQSLRGFYYSHDSIKLTRHCLPGAIEQTEVENVPFTAYSKSVTFTFIEMAISFAYGSHGVTMNLYDHAGTPMERDPGLGRMLGDRKAWCNALASRAQLPGSYRGVQLLHHDDNALGKRLAAPASVGDLAEDGHQLPTLLEALGIPTTYDPEDVVAASGQILRAFTDDRLRELLAGGLLLDIDAARLLAERGFAREIGLVGSQPPVHLDQLGAFSAEEVHHPDFGGAPGRYLTATLPGLGGRPHVSILQPHPDATIISHLVDPDAVRHHPCMYAYENDLGGRVVVHAMTWHSAFGTAFLHPYRLAQFQHAVRWLCRDRAPLLVNGGVYPLAFRKDCGDRTLLGLFNLSLDAWPQVDFQLHSERSIDRVEQLTCDATWQPIQPTWVDGILHWPHPVEHQEPLVLTLYWAG